jgi:hypothetical protein
MEGIYGKTVGRVSEEPELLRLLIVQPFLLRLGGDNEI